MSVLMPIKLVFLNACGLGRDEFMEELLQLASEWNVCVDPIWAKTPEDEQALTRMTGSIGQLEPYYTKADRRKRGK